MNFLPETDQMLFSECVRVCMFVFTNAGRVVLGEARWTLAREPTDGVDAQELTVVLLGGAFIQI